MSKYHTSSLDDADVFTFMGSIYAEVARYDAAMRAKNQELADLAVARADELIGHSSGMSRLNAAQKKEVNKFAEVFAMRVKANTTSGLDGYLMPFAVAQRMHA